MRSGGEAGKRPTAGASGKGSRIFAASLGIMRAPAKPISRPLERRFESRYRGRYRFALALFYIDLAMLALALGLLSVSVSYLAAPVRSAKVEPYQVAIGVEPAEPRLGEQVAITISVKNRSGHAIVDAELETRFPEGFRSVDGKEPTRTIGLGDLAAGASADVGFDFVAMRSGRLADGDIERIFAILSGTGESGAVSYETSYELRFSGQAVAIDLDLPERVSTGSEIDVPIRVSNAGTVTLGPVGLSLCGRGSFAIVGSVDGCLVMDLGRLPPGGMATSSIEVMVGMIYEGNGILDTTLSVVDSAGRSYLGERSDEIRSFADMVALSLGESPAVLSGKGGDKVTVVVKNMSDGEPERLDIVFVGGSESERAVYRADDAVLESLASGSDATATIDLPSGRGPGAGLVAVVGFAGGSPEAKYRSDVLRLPDPLRLDFSAAGRYFTADGEQLGRGPLPPTVGEKTEYWVFWNVAPVDRDLKLVKITARLPAGVSWSGKRSVSLQGGPEVEYDPESGIVSWEAVDISKTIASQGFGAAFAVAVTPLAADVGEELELVGAAGLTAVSEDGVSVGDEVPPVTTSIVGDAAAAGKGIVIE